MVDICDARGHQWQSLSGAPSVKSSNLIAKSIIRMKKNEFLALSETKSFINWLSPRVNNNSLDFQYSEEGSDSTISAAKNRYQWPPKACRFFTPAREVKIVAKSSFCENQKILDEIKRGLQNSLKNADDQQLAAWIESTLRWGGVFTARASGKGNKGWLEEKRSKGDIRDYLSECLKKLAVVNDDSIRLEIKNLRSNAGFTKVYSLALDDFIIYDSRVAAALTWLVSSWAEDEGCEVPEWLKFVALQARTSSNYKPSRNANKKIFSTISISHIRDHQRHLLWNIRANWLLNLVLHEQNKFHWGSHAITTLREFEAGLFVMGADLNYARQFK